MTRGGLRLWLVAVVLLCAAGAALAHIVPTGVGIQQYLKPQPRKVYLEYNLGFSDFAGYAEVLKMETSRDNILQQAEIDAWLAALEPRLLANIAVSLDEKPLTFRVAKRNTVALFPGVDVTRIPGLAFDSWWYLEADVDIGPGEHRFDMYDRNFEREESQSIVWFPKRPPGFDEYAFEGNPKSSRVFEMATEYQIYARGATIYVEFSKATLAAAATPTAAPAPEPAAATVTASSEGMKQTAVEAAQRKGIVYRGAEELAEQRQLIGLKDEIWYLAFGLALVYGAAHALAPGHGKSMIAAHLLGTQGRLRDALVLGGVVTLTHSAGNFLIAIGAFALAQAVFQMNEASFAGKMTIGLEVLSGIGVFLIGGGLLYRRLKTLERAARNGRGHGHSHGLFGEHHHHGPGGHTHGKPGESVLSLGFWAGLQPCTAGIALTFFSIQQHWLWKGLYLQLAFSLGLGLVILAVAVAMVLAKSYAAEKVPSEGLWMQALPVVSAVLLTSVGAWMVIDCLSRNKVGPFAHS